ncbi:hypothetical protein R52603_03177 [Paraburkholderia saeva]|uniref:Uncharacterized protein n=1 Tax=Paraburkholderia saeva TaxID=2777537 RepID=A0A9N8X3N1_9BURK|nr:hypothetical protein R70241_00725 [Paraburkholderia saeva]CAG4904201.1 hypothetical protein R52603_03177 [Paraburkholderia saeva]CAG4915167.1 hypothetical protein LMG31841_04449 [Paraburkholderia saeva]
MAILIPVKRLGWLRNGQQLYRAASSAAGCCHAIATML